MRKEVYTVPKSKKKDSFDPENMKPEDVLKFEIGGVWRQKKADESED